MGGDSHDRRVERRGVRIDQLARPADAGSPLHVHPNSEESFEVVEGTFDVFLDGEWSRVQAGETATVPPNAPHTLKNASDGPAKLITRIKPAGRSEELFRHMHRLIEEGKIGRLPPNRPRSAIYAAMVFGAYPDEILTAKPPNGVFKAIAAARFIERYLTSAKHY